jgi:hypothetical protein
MPIDVRVDPEPQLAIFTAHGPVSIALIVEALERLRHDPYVRPGIRRLWDGRDATVTLSAPEVQYLVGLLARRGAQAAGRSAIVMGSPLAYGIGRMFQVYAEIARLPTKIEVFAILDGALAWLGVGEDTIRESTEE